MKGRGTRVIDYDDLKKVSPSAKLTKDHFVIVDAIGVTKSLKTDSRPLDKKPGVPLKELLGAVASGAREEELFTTLASRLARLDRQLSDKEKTEVERRTGGLSLAAIAHALLGAFNPDIEDDIRVAVQSAFPGESPDAVETEVGARIAAIRNQAARPFTGDFNEYIDNVRRAHEQTIDSLNIDEVIYAGGDEARYARSQSIVEEFNSWVASHRDQIVALRIFYDQPYRRRELTYDMIKELSETLVADKPSLAPLQVWQAYEDLEKVQGKPGKELVALVALLRRVAGIDGELRSWESTVAKNFQDWIFSRHAGSGEKFNEEQMEWLRMIRDHIASSVHVSMEDLDRTPFDANGGRGKMWQLFGDGMNDIMDEMNEKLAV